MKIKQNLKCILTTEELAEIGRRLGGLNREQAQLKSQAKEAASQYKARIDSAQVQIEELSDTMNCGYEYRNVDCDVLFNTPTEGFKVIIRSDTGEQVSKLAMTEEEMQDLFINGLGANAEEHEFVFRDKSRCRFATADELETLGSRGEASFEKLTEEPITAEQMVDREHNRPELLLVVEVAEDRFALYQFLGAAPATEGGEDVSN